MFIYNSSSHNDAIDLSGFDLFFSSLVGITVEGLGGSFLGAAGFLVSLIKLL